jgi:hypothetical protein
MHSQIILGLFMIPFNSNPTAHRKRAKQKKKKRKEKKERGAQAIIATLIQRSQAGDKQPTEEPLMIVILKPSGSESRGFPSHHSSDRRCT